MTNVLDRELADAPEELSAARTQAAGPPESTLEDYSAIFVSPGSRWRADQLLLDHVKEESLGGPRFEALLNELIAYALPVMESFIRSGRIFMETARHGRPVAKPDWFTPDDAEDLVAETVVEGIRLFRDQLEQGAWNPSEKTSLSTYMVGACVRSFPNVFRRFERSHAKWLTHNLAAGVVDYEFFHAETTRSAEDTVLARQSICSAIADLSCSKQKLVFLVAHEMPQDEIAKELGISTRAVEGRVRRAREELRELLASKSRRWSVVSAREYDTCPASRYWVDACSDK
ncbi:sigma-70 family RNA polymerase sigma factor [Lentzea sp. NPDC051838]|uniref:RNA polymerase sigma factor n=1 Tax=Lentzea sp. NPDC051838 TaxID=3154849 RepID=UPI00342EB764